MNESDIKVVEAFAEESGLKTSQYKALLSCPVYQYTISKEQFISQASEDELAYYNDAMDDDALEEKYTDINDVITVHGEADSVFLVLDGVLKTYLVKHEEKVLGNGKVDIERKEVVINLHEAGELLGEVGVIADSRRTASVKPMTRRVRVLHIDAELFKSFYEESVEFSNYLLLSVVHRLGDLTQTTHSLALDKVSQRLKHVLETRFATGIDASSGNRLIPEEVTHKEIAQHIGSTRAGVSTLMKKLINADYIAVMPDGCKMLKKSLPESI